MSAAMMMKHDSTLLVVTMMRGMDGFAWNPHDVQIRRSLVSSIIQNSKYVKSFFCT